MSDSIVFIHGARLASNSWDGFAADFAGRGYATLTPDSPHQALQESVDYHASIIGELAEPPILIGHSLGGLIAQILNGQGLARAAVALAPAHDGEMDVDSEDRGPLLIAVGEKDQSVPPAVAKANFREYRHSAALTEFVEFPGRSHVLMAGPGWEEVAEYIAGWLDRVLRPAPVQEA